MSQFIEVELKGTDPLQKVSINLDHVVKIVSMGDDTVVMTLITKDLIHANETYGQIKGWLRYGKDLD